MAEAIGHATCSPPSTTLQLMSLPNELIAKIFSMHNELPPSGVLLAVPGHSREHRFLFQQGMGRAKRGSPRMWSHALPMSQRLHFLDWLSVTGTCRLFRECGHSAFFAEKAFIIPPSTLRALQENRHRSQNIDLAKASIRHIMIPITTFEYSVTWALYRDAIFSTD